MTPFLHLKDITVAFGGQRLLDGAELSVEMPATASAWWGATARANPP